MKNYSKLYSREHYSRWSDSEKKKAVLLYLSGDYTKNSIAKDFGVSNAGLSKWINRFAEEILVLQKKKKTLTSDYNKLETSMANKSLHDSDKDKEIARLKQELYLSQVKNDILEAMIDIAKEDFNIDLRKKAGPQQYKNAVNKKDTKS